MAVLKRSAAETKSSTSPKKQTKKRPARVQDTAPADPESQPPPPEIAPPPDAALAGLVNDESAVAIVRRALAWQIEEIRVKPSKESTDAVARARDARTLTDLVRTLERLDALEKRREGKGKTKKAKPLSDADVKERIVRRLDKLAAGGAARGPAGKSERA